MSVIVFQHSPSTGCPANSKKGYGPIRMVMSVCRAIHGAWNGNPADNEQMDCYLDWCTTPPGMPFTQHAQNVNQHNITQEHLL